MKDARAVFTRLRGLCEDAKEEWEKYPWVKRQHEEVVRAMGALGEIRDALAPEVCEEAGGVTLESPMAAERRRMAAVRALVDRYFDGR